jgi:hypothetical protein
MAIIPYGFLTKCSGADIGRKLVNNETDLSFGPASY